MTCRACGARHWRNPKPCAGGLVERDGTLLLIRRAIAPWRAHWDIPGGFCDPDEHPADTVVREVREETGLDVAVERLLGIWMDVYDDGGSAGADATMNCYFIARPVDDRVVAVDPAEVSAAEWFPADALPDALAFPDHARQVLAAWRAASGSGSPAG